MELKSVISLFLFLCLLGHLDCTDVSDEKELKVKGGEDATLECSGPDATLVMMRWEKSDLQSEDFVILFRDGRFQENLQHELFKGRVKMKDPKWKETGYFSVILKHVTTNDAGTYECEAAYDGQKPQSLNRVTLKVENSGQTGGQSGGKEDEKNDGGQNSGLTVGLSVSAVLLVVFVAGFVFYRNCRGRPLPNNPMI